LYEEGGAAYLFPMIGTPRPIDADSDALFYGAAWCVVHGELTEAALHRAWPVPLVTPPDWAGAPRPAWAEVAEAAGLAVG
jgi:hypothetical protein